MVGEIRKNRDNVNHFNISSSYSTYLEFLLMLLLAFQFVFLDVIGQDVAPEFQELECLLTSVLSQL